MKISFTTIEKNLQKWKAHFSLKKNSNIIDIHSWKSKDIIDIAPYLKNAKKKQKKALTKKKKF